MIGGQDELLFDGRSQVITKQGKVAAEAAFFEEDLLLYDCLMKPRKKDLKKSKQPKIKYVILNTVMALEHSPVRKQKVKKIPLIEEIYTALKIGVHDYASKNSFQKVLIGLSGGIDSALTALVAYDALGSENVVCVTMPSKYSSKGTKKDAKILANRLGARVIEIPIQNIFHKFIVDLSSVFKNMPSDSTEENIQARIRGVLLMALSNKFGWLVLSTGNKSETSCGYSTLYGDMAGGLNVLKDIYKTTVYDLARWRNERDKRPLIPGGIFKRMPSAELRPNQKDQDTLPAYPLLDKILKWYIEEKLSGAKIIKKGFDRTVVNRVIHMVETSEHKRRQAPPGIKITNVAFGRDRRFPITNRYRG